MKWWKQKEEVFKTSLFRLPLGVTRGRAGYCVGFMPFTRIYDRKKNSISYLFLIFFWKLKLKKFESKQLLPKFYNYCHFSLVFEPFNGKYLGQQCKIIKKKRIDKQLWPKYLPLEPFLPFTQILHELKMTDSKLGKLMSKEKEKMRWSWNDLWIDYSNKRV